ncbi:hypothetical protein GCM10023115_51580 [Pontixanthobacter gangjinensis]
MQLEKYGNRNNDRDSKYDSLGEICTPQEFPKVMAIFTYSAGQVGLGLDHEIKLLKPINHCACSNINF